MATVSGTVDDIKLLCGEGTGPGARKVYLVVASFGTYTGSTDVAQITGIAARIQEFTKNGKTLTARAAMAGPPGHTSTGAAVYTAPTITLASGTLDFDLGGVTAEADVAASTGVGLLVVCDES